MRLGSVAVVGTRPEALNLAEELAASDELAGVTVYGRVREAPAHTVFARGLARYVYGLEPFDPSTFAVLIAVPDEGVPETAVSIAGQGPAPGGCAAFHLSPTLPSDALAPLHRPGYALGVFQPFGGDRPGATTLDGPAGEGHGQAGLSGGFVAVTGSPAAISVARRLCDALGAEVLEVPAGRRPLVDAASVLVSGSLAPLLALSSRLMERAGIAADDVRPALIAAARAALARAEQGATSEASAHPARRGDPERVALHLRALDGEDQRLYAVLASEMLRIEGGSVDAATRVAIDQLLSRYLDIGVPEARGIPGDAQENLDPQPTSVG